MVNVYLLLLFYFVLPSKSLWRFSRRKAWAALAPFRPPFGCPLEPIQAGEGGAAPRAGLKGLFVRAVREGEYILIF